MLNMWGGHGPAPFSIHFVLRHRFIILGNVMTLAPLLNANAAIQIHVSAVMIAIILTPIQLILQRGSNTHRFVGRIWMLAFALTALSSFFIHTIRMVGPFSPLHILSIVALGSLLNAYRAARRGDVENHRWTILSLIGFALFGAGIFTLLPGRIMHHVLFG